MDIRLKEKANHYSFRLNKTTENAHLEANASKQTIN